MKVPVTGVKGRLGHDVVGELVFRGIEGFGADVEEMDTTDRTARETAISQEKPDAAIHYAAYAAVNAVGDNLELCRKINAEGTRNIARVCRAMDIKMMYISTDHVFNGGGERPWEPNDHRGPFSMYGLTKYEGEIAVEQNVQKYLIVCIAWVFGVNGKNFIKTMFRLGKEKGAVSVVNDQTGSPTYTHDLACLLVDAIQTDKYGRYYVTNEGLCSWYEFAREIFRQADMDEVKVTPVDSDGFPAKAKRPSSSCMSKEKLTENGFERLPSWQNTLECYLKAFKDNGTV